MEKVTIKELKKLLNKDEFQLLKEIIMTKYETLLAQIKNNDRKEKKSLIEMIDTFKKRYKKSQGIEEKFIIGHLISELEEINLLGKK